MSALTQTRAANFLNHEFAAAAFTALVAGRRLKLVTNTTTASFHEATGGTEVAVQGDYVANGVTIAFNTATNDAAAPATYSQKIGNQAKTLTNMAATTVGGVEIWDGAQAAAPTTRAAWGLVTTTRTTASGDTLSFAADSIVVRI